MADELAEEPGLSVLALWADTIRVYALFHDTVGQVFMLASTLVESGVYAALSPHRPACAWFERMVQDLWAHSAAGGRDPRHWLDHGRWPTIAPMAARPALNHAAPEPLEFLPSEGEDLHQIPLGPVYAEITEPGHFRLTAAGETVVRLEVRLGYAHKGTLGLMRRKSPRAAARFAARLSGDSTVAHSIAFARGAEAASDTDAPPRACALRGVMAEMERVANHIGDCGAVADAAGFAFLPARCRWHREAMLVAADTAFGHRLMMDCVIPGGVAADIAPGGPEAIMRALNALDAELPQLLGAYDASSSLADRMVGTGAITPELAARVAAGGYVGRAAGRNFDARKAPGYPPYDTLAFDVPLLSAGDVDARVRLRFAELRESVRILRTLLVQLPDGPASVPLLPANGEAIGWAEGFRGDCWHWLRLDGGMISSVFMRDPSWVQWPLLEAAMHGDVIGDFPLCGSSFNGSCSGVDL